MEAGNGPSLEAHGTGTALGDPIEVRAYFFIFSHESCVIVGGSCHEGIVQSDRPWNHSNPVHVAEVERGPLRAGGSGRGPGVAGGRTSDGFCCCCECAVARVRPLRFTCIVILFVRRLNAHLSSIVSSKPFQMPVDVVPRTTAASGSRLSSFGFSGTIAHGAFEILERVALQGKGLSLYRNKKSLSFVTIKPVQ